MHLDWRFLKIYGGLIGVVLITKFAVLFFIPWLSTFLLPESRAINQDAFHLWNIWDANTYITIAKNGYQNNPDENTFIAFSPFFPFLVATLNFLFRIPHLLGGYLVSFFATIFLGIFFYKLLLIDFEKKVAFWGVVFLFIFPGSFFLHIPYTESLFLALSISSFYFLRKKHFWLAFLLAAFATATRLQGLALIPAFLIELLVFEKSLVKEKPFILLGALMVPLMGFLAYLIINEVVFGNPFQFMVVQRQNWSNRFSVKLEGLKAAFGYTDWGKGMDKLTLGYAQVAAFFLALASLVYGVFKIRISYFVFALVVFLMNSSQSFWLGQMRNMMVIFPMYIMLAVFAKNDLFKFGWTIFSILMFMTFCLIGVQYGPIL